MNYPTYIVSNQMDEFISIQMVKGMEIKERYIYILRNNLIWKNLCKNL